MLSEVKASGCIAAPILGSVGIISGRDIGGSGIGVVIFAVGVTFA